MSDANQDFYASIPIFDDFADAVKSQNYRALPDDWIVGFSDVVGSTQAVVEGRYKTVNMIGAGVIAAVTNALGRRAFPFVFGGDGASFAVAPADGGAAKDALRAMATFAGEEFQMNLRVAAISVGEIRAAGRDVRVARYGASKHCAYAMFSGGGLSWFEGAAKRGDYALARAEAGARPDLSGLSCRWGLAPARNGIILSLIVTPRGDDPRFAALVEEVARAALGAKDGGRPVSVDALQPENPARAIGLESAALRASGVARTRARLQSIFRYGLGYAFQTFNLSTKSFHMSEYLEDIVGNSDFRKFDDGLRMTLDCTPEFADAVEARLAAAGDYANHGAFRQNNALLTCFVPSLSDRGHVHFVDGAGGGYTMAAKTMKARAAAA